jgi:hypothetical protein
MGIEKSSTVDHPAASVNERPTQAVENRKIAVSPLTASALCVIQ